jgi:hypothetical protein
MDQPFFPKFAPKTRWPNRPLADQNETIAERYPPHAILLLSHHIRLPDPLYSEVSLNLSNALI